MFPTFVTIRVKASLLFHRAIVDVEGNNKLDITLIPVNKCKIVRQKYPVSSVLII